MRLILLGDVVVGVLLEVAKLAGRLDAVRHRDALWPLELGKLCLESVEPLGRDRLRHGYASTARRPANARPRVTSSACSRSAPTGRPLASRVI